MYKIQSFRLSVNEQLTSAGEEILCVLEKQQHCYHYYDHGVRVLVLGRLQAASQLICSLFQREMEDLHTLLERYNSLLLDLSNTTADESVESSLQVKMSSPVLARTLSVKQEPEDHLYLNFENLPKDDLSPEEQERSPCLVQEEPEPPQIKAKQEELLQRQEEAGGSTMTSLAVKSEEGGENSETEPPASTSTGHIKTQADVEDCGALQPTSDGQLLPSHRYEPDTEDSDEWEETRQDQSGQRYALSNELSQDLKSAEQIPSMRSHREETSVSCAVCGKLFAFSGRLIRHMRTHTGEKPFSCAVCGKSFNQSEILKRHLKIHTAEKIFNCTVCSKSFNRTGNLKTHMRIHTGERPFNCTVCGKSFTLNGHLKTHMRIHTGEKPFTCTVCCKGFGQKIGLERHMRNHTGGGFL